MRKYSSDLEKNYSLVKIAKVKGEFDWHLHENEDEMFLIVKGELILKYRDREELLKKGEMALVSRLLIKKHIY